MKKMRKMKERIFCIVLTCAMVVSLLVGIQPMEVHAEDGATLTYEVVGGTGSMAPVTLTAGESFTLPEPSFTPNDGRVFFGWVVFDEDDSMVVTGYSNTTILENVEAGKTYKAIAYYGYKITVNNLPDDTEIMHGSMLTGNLTPIVVPEFTGNMLEGNAFIISNSSMTSAPSFTGDKGTATFLKTTEDGKHMYLVENITGPVTLTLTASSNPPAQTTTLTYEVVGGTGSMAPVTLTVGESFTLPEPSFTPNDGRVFFGWVVFDEDDSMVVTGYSNTTILENVEAGKTYKAIAYYGYKITVNNLPDDTEIMHGSMLTGNLTPIVVPEFTGNMLEGNAFIISNSSMTSAPSFTGDKGTATFLKTTEDGKHMYLVENITGPVTLTLTVAPEVSGNIELKENVSITKLEANKYEVQGLEEETGFTWVYNLVSVDESQDVNEKVATELAGWLSAEKGKYVELKKVWGTDDDPYIISGVFLSKQIDDYDYVQIFKLDAQENVHEVALLALPKDAAPEVTYDITLDRTNYADGYVELYTYNSEGTNVADTQENNATIAMPEGGKVRVFADSEFTVTAEGATISEMLSGGEEGYYYELTGIAADTTVVVNKVTTQEPAEFPALQEGLNIVDLGDDSIWLDEDNYINFDMPNSANDGKDGDFYYSVIKVPVSSEALVETYRSIYTSGIGYPVVDITKVDINNAEANVQSMSECLRIYGTSSSGGLGLPSFPEKSYAPIEEKTLVILLKLSKDRIYKVYEQGVQNEYNPNLTGGRADVFAVYGVHVEVLNPEPPHTHTVKTTIDTVSATCTTDGNNKYYKCDCGKFFKDAECTTETTEEAVKIAALGHDWNGEWTITKEATATEEGKKETLCERDCGQKKVVIIPATGTTDDNGNLEKDAEVEPEASIEEATLNNSKEELLGAGNIFTDTEKEQVANGTNARVWLEVTKTDESAIASTDKAKIEQEATQIMGDNLVITYFDADLFKQVGTQVGTNEKTPVPEPGVAIKITITIPDELLNSDGTISREYQIIRLHEGQVDVISGTFDSATGEFTFESDKFSTYAIVYKDVPVNDNTNPTPGDGDNTNPTPGDGENENPTPGGGENTNPTPAPGSGENTNPTPGGGENTNPTPAPGGGENPTPAPGNNDVVNSGENKLDEVPKTGESNVTLYFFILMLLSGAGVVICSRIKKNSNKES